jgi:hypothetical protein
MLLRLLKNLLTPKNLFEVDFPTPEPVKPSVEAPPPPKKKKIVKRKRKRTLKKEDGVIHKGDLTLARVAVRIFQEFHYVNVENPKKALCGLHIFRKRFVPLVKDGKVTEITCKDCARTADHCTGTVRIARPTKTKKKEDLGRTGKKKPSKPPINDGISGIKHLGPIQ